MHMYIPIFILMYMYICKHINDYVHLHSLWCEDEYNKNHHAYAYPDFNMHTYVDMYVRE